MSFTEIERKFEIEGFPTSLACIEQSTMYQGYLSTKPVVRIRKKETATGCTYKVCFKGEGTIARTELELDITAEEYETLATLLIIPPVSKEQRVYTLENGLKLECNLVDKGSDTAFYYAEIEFPTIEAAHAFQPPYFLGKEKTADMQFTMAEYWCKKINSSKKS